LFVLILLHRFSIFLSLLKVYIVFIIHNSNILFCMFWVVFESSLISGD
jgi:hypothetical protein